MRRQQLSNNRLRYIVQIIFILIGISYIIICPYNKVEESFNIQATYDLYYYGIRPAWEHAVRQQQQQQQQNQPIHYQKDDTPSPPSPPQDRFNPTIIPWLHRILSITNSTMTSTTTTSSVLPYDHIKYPGVVPRTFFGAYIISWVCYMIRTIILYVSYFTWDISNHPYMIQFISRCILLLFNISQFFNMVTSIDHLIEVMSTTKSTSPPSVPSTVSSSTTTKNINILFASHPPSMVGTYLIIITGCQFHLLYYYSRMLPNTFACIFILRCYYHWITAIAIRYPSIAKINPKEFTNYNQWYHLFEMTGAMIDITLSTMVFRCDCILLLATIGVTWIITRHFTILQGIVCGVGTVLCITLCSMMTVLPLDTLLWQRFVWAEGEVFYYNTILNKSSNWGVSAWHWYFTSALPKALLLPYVYFSYFVLRSLQRPHASLISPSRVFFIPFSFLRIPELFVTWERRFRQYLRKSKLIASFPPTILLDTTYFQFLLPALGFVALYSGLGHKEVRFLYPAIPLFNMCAAIGLCRIHDIRFPSKEKLPSTVAKVLYALAILGLIVSFTASVIFVAISRYNYPGGDALQLLSRHVNERYNANIVNNDETKLHVNLHIDVASAMTGVNLFGQRAALAANPSVVWSFHKDGYEQENDNTDVDWKSFTHLLTESKEKILPPDNYAVIGVAQGNPRLDFRRGAIATSASIYILERKDWINQNR